MGINKHDKLWKLLESRAEACSDNHVQDIVRALIPANLNAEEIEFLIILYIKMLKTDVLLYSELDKKDPYNRYMFLPTLNLVSSSNIVFDDIINNITALHILPHTRDYTFLDLILNALSTIIAKL